MTVVNQRKLVSAILRNRNQTVGLNHGHSLSLWIIDYLRSRPKSSAKDAEKAVRQQIPDRLFLCELSISCLALIFACINEKTEKDYPFPSDWISRSGKPNPNFVMRSLVGQVADYSSSVLTLIKTGMDNPARSLLRVTDELISQSLIIIADRDHMEEYVKADTPDEANDTWRKLFGRGKLIRKIERLEKELGFDEEYLGSMSKWRKDSMAYYSQAVHHSYVATAVGLFSLSLDEKTAGHGIFGSPKVGLRGTIDHLNFQLFYFVNFLYTILEKKHSIVQKEEKLFCYFAETLRWCQYALYANSWIEENKFSKKKKL